MHLVGDALGAYEATEKIKRCSFWFIMLQKLTMMERNMSLNWTDRAHWGCYLRIFAALSIISEDYIS